LIKLLSILFTIIGFGIPVLSYWNSDYRSISIILAFLPLLWLFARSKGLYWVNSLTLVLGIVAIALGSWLNFPTFLILLSTILILVAWDLANYTEFIKLADPKDQVTLAERYHLKNIIIFLVFTSFISYLSLRMRLQTSFIIVIILIVLVIFGILTINRLVQNSRR
jgi:hypothetical protein